MTNPSNRDSNRDSGRDWSAAASSMPDGLSGSVPGTLQGSTYSRMATSTLSPAPWQGEESGRSRRTPRRSTAMLSRVADSLYWMGRYLERADHVARQLDVHLTIVPEQAFEAARRRRNRLITCLVRADYPAAVIQNDQDLAYLLTFDEDNPNSIVRCIAGGRENARQVREQVNSQMWEQINQLYLQMQTSSMAQIWAGQPHRFYHGINQDIYKLQGITDSRITRDQGWHFIQLGRYIERASEVADMLDVDFRELLTAQGHVPGISAEGAVAHPGDLLRGAAAGIPGADEMVDQQTYLDWVGLLRGAAAYEAYSKMYTANVYPRTIIEFLLLNPSFPYAVHFAINAVQRSLEAIGDATEMPKAARVYRLAGRLRAMLDYASVDEIMEGGLGHYLQDIQARCAEIHDTIYSTYIAYPIADRLNRD
jgi:uncharacterized alpha-E superfamily protein